MSDSELLGGVQECCNLDGDDVILEIFAGGAAEEACEGDSSSRFRLRLRGGRLDRGSNKGVEA